MTAAAAPMPAPRTPESKGLSKEAIARLDALSEAGGGRLDHDDVLAEAKKKSSPLHSYYNWDVHEAAREHWLAQTRVLLRRYYTFKVEYVTHTTVAPYGKGVTVETELPKFVNDPSKRGGMVSIDQLKSEPENANAFMAREVSCCLGLLRRAKGYGAELGIKIDVDRCIAQLTKLHDALLGD